MVSQEDGVFTAGKILYTQLLASNNKFTAKLKVRMSQNLCKQKWKLTIKPKINKNFATFSKQISKQNPMNKIYCVYK